MAEWDESKHPRVPSGDVNGGQFTDKQVSAAAGAARIAAGLRTQSISRDAMFNAIKDATGINPSIEDYVVMSSEEFNEFLRQHGETVDVDNIAAINIGNKIYVRSGYEDSALHEFIHSAGFMQQHIGDYVNEGMTQALTEDLARELGITTRSGYKKDVDFVNKYVIPLAGDNRMEVFRGYATATDKRLYLAKSIWERHGHRFTDTTEWGTNIEEHFLKWACESTSGDVYLEYLVDELKVTR